MPIYEYSCQDCGTKFEKFVRSSTAKVDLKCPQCGGGHTKKAWSVFGTSTSGGGLGSLGASAATSCSPSGT